MISALKISADKTALCGVAKSHDVQSATDPATRAMNIAGMIAKYFATSLAIEKVVRAPRVISICLPIPDQVDQLGRVGIEIDQVRRLLGRVGAGMHRQPDVGLSQRGSIVGAVAGHRDQPPLRLLLADQPELFFGLRLGHEVVDSGLGGNRAAQ